MLYLDTILSNKYNFDFVREYEYITYMNLFILTMFIITFKIIIFLTLVENIFHMVYSKSVVFKFNKEL